MKELVRDLDCRSIATLTDICSARPTARPTANPSGMNVVAIAARLMVLIHGLASLAISKVCRKSRNMVWSIPLLSSSGA